MAIIPAEEPITIYKGADYTQAYQVLASEDDDTPLDLSDYTIKSQIRVKAGLTEEKIADFGVDIPSPTDGTFTLSLSDADTRDIVYKKGYYDVVLTIGDLSEVYFYGDIEFREMATDISG